MDTQPPIVDLAGLAEGDERALARVASDLVAPCSEWGVLQITGHGIDGSKMERFAAAVEAFFDLPEAVRRAIRRTRDNARGYYDEELTKNRRDWKEVFDYGAERRADASDAFHSDGVNQWPEGSPELRAVLLDWFGECERLSASLLRAICVSLDLPPTALDSAFVGHTSFVRLNRYAPCPDPAPSDAELLPRAGHLGVHHHTDAGALTLVHQDRVAGLQVLHGDAFVTIQPIEGALTVNLADMLQVWSNDRYTSPLHRVITHRDRTRHSAPFFLNPSYDTVCAPLPKLVVPGQAPRYHPISWGEFRDRRSAGDYADYGHEIQIADFRQGGAAPTA